MAQPAETSKALESEIFLSKYKYLKTVGKGSFGEAVLVRSKADNKRYIAKAIESAAMTPKEKRDVQNEIRILSAVNHPNIIRYQEHFEDGSLIFIIMEYADGGDLNQRIKDRKKGDGPHEPFDPKLAMFWFLQIAMALKFLHDKHILHRDLKTANIFLTSKDVVKLGDFGISTVLQNTMACAKTVCGTPYYFSPELCQSQPYNNKSDVWALGIVLYEMLTLNRPFNAKSLRELLKKILAGQYEPIPESVPAEVRQLCQSLLQSNPQMRPSVNRILEAPFVQRSLKTFSEELQSQTSKERREYEERKRAQAAAQAAAPQAAAAPAAAPVAVAPAAPAVDMKDLKQMGAQGLRAMMMQQGAALQAEIEAQKQRAAAGPTASPAGPVDDGNANAEEVGDLLAQKEVMLKDAAGMVGVGRLGGHEDEFGDVNAGPAQEETIPLASGQVVLARDARGALETEMGAPLVACALNFVNELMASPAAPSNAQIQRELNALLGVKYAQHSASITRLAVWESKHL